MQTFSRRELYGFIVSILVRNFVRLYVFTLIFVFSQTVHIVSNLACMQVSAELRFVHKHSKIHSFQNYCPTENIFVALLFPVFKKLFNSGFFLGTLGVLKLHFVIANQDDTAFWDFVGYLIIQYCLQVVK